MTSRIVEELRLLQKYYGEVEAVDGGRWIRIASYRVPRADCNRKFTEVAFQIAQGFPGQPPYGFAVPAGILFGGVRPNNYTEPSQNPPPFPGIWGFFSWQPLPGQWKPALSVENGTNLLNWTLGFAQRFREGA